MGVRGMARLAEIGVACGERRAAGGGQRRARPTPHRRRRRPERRPRRPPARAPARRCRRSGPSAGRRRARAGPLRLTNAAGLSIAAVDLGTGASGVVLAHQSDGSLCEWLPYGEALAAKGFRVLAFDFAGSGSSSMPKQKTYVEDLRTAVTYLRGAGRHQGRDHRCLDGRHHDGGGRRRDHPAGGRHHRAVAAAVLRRGERGEGGAVAAVAGAVRRRRTGRRLRVVREVDRGGDPGGVARAADRAGHQHGIQLLDAEVQSTVLVRTAVEQFLACTIR